MGASAIISAGIPLLDFYFFCMDLRYSMISGLCLAIFASAGLPLCLTVVRRELYCLRANNYQDINQAFTVAPSGLSLVYNKRV